MNIHRFTGIYLWTTLFCIAVYSYSILIYPVLLGPPAHSCYFIQLFNIPCPACGGSHAIQSLCHGDLLKAIYFNPIIFILFIILILTSGLMLIDLLFSKKLYTQLMVKIKIVLRNKRNRYILAVILLFGWVFNVIRYWNP